MSNTKNRLKRSNFGMHSARQRNYPQLHRAEEFQHQFAITFSVRGDSNVEETQITPMTIVHAHPKI